MKNRIFVGPPGFGKTYYAKREVVKIIWNQMGEEEKREQNARFFNPANFCEEAFNYIEKQYIPSIRLASLHEGMSTSDFIEGITIETKDGLSSFTKSDKMVLQLLEELKTTEKPGFLILDDVHRVNIAGVLGELLYAFAHREEMITLSSGKTISVPNNLYVFMTMNTLRPEFPIDPAVFSSFQITYMEEGEQCLRKAIEEGFYKSAYYNIERDIVDRLMEIQNEYITLKKEILDAGDSCEAVSDIERLFCVDMGECFREESARLFRMISFPAVLEKRTDISNRFRKRYNDISEKFCAVINEAAEMYSKFYSDKTLELLEQFKTEAVEEYHYYNDFLDYIAPEYHHDKANYRIGYTYFLPGHGFSMWNASELLQNKIRAQVLPLLRQYENEGIIVGCRVPEIRRTSTAYTRDKTEVGEERIEIVLNAEYRDIFLGLYSARASTKGIKNPMNRSQPYNPTYGVLFEIVNDIITHPLINT